MSLMSGHDINSCKHDNISWPQDPYMKQTCE